MRPTTVVSHPRSSRICKLVASRVFGNLKPYPRFLHRILSVAETSGETVGHRSQVATVLLEVLRSRRRKHALMIRTSHIKSGMNVTVDPGSGCRRMVSALLTARSCLHIHWSLTCFGLSRSCRSTVVVELTFPTPACAERRTRRSGQV